MDECYFKIYQPRFTKEQYQSGQVIPILYPIYAYSLICTVGTKCELNVFQDTIFRVIISGCLKIDEIAQLSNLDNQLVLWIIQTQLINSRGLLDEKWRITKAGEQYLSNNDDDNAEIKMILAYQDGLTGEWLPRFMYKNEFDKFELDVESFDDRNFPTFLVNREKGLRDKPFVIPFLFKNNRLPDFSSLFNQPKREYLSDFSFAKENQNEHKNFHQSTICRIVVTPKQPKRIWIYAYLFCDENSAQKWLVSDLFGLKDAVAWLRKPIQENISQLPELAKKIAVMLGLQESEKLSPQKFLQHIEEQSRLQLVAEYAWIGDIPNATDYLIQVLKLQKKLQQLDSEQDAKYLLIECQNLVESVLKHWVKQFPINQKRLPKKVFLEYKIDEILSVLPIKLPVDVQKQLSYQKIGDVYSALIKNDKSLKATLIAVLMTLVEYPQHPILSVSVTQLELAQLLKMADLRNRVGHASAYQITEKISQEQALKMADFVIQWISLFKK